MANDQSRTYRKNEVLGIVTDNESKLEMEKVFKERELIENMDIICLETHDFLRDLKEIALKEQHRKTIFFRIDKYIEEMYGKIKSPNLQDYSEEDLMNLDVEQVVIYDLGEEFAKIKAVFPTQNLALLYVGTSRLQMYSKDYVCGLQETTQEEWQKIGPVYTLLQIFATLYRTYSTKQFEKYRKYRKGKNNFPIYNFGYGMLLSQLKKAKEGLTA